MNGRITVDAGGAIDAGSLVVAEERYLDYKAPLPRHFDKMVVVKVEPLRAYGPPPEIFGVCTEIEEALLSKFNSKRKLVMTSTPMGEDSYFRRCMKDEV